jgi:hypothetical protein
VIPEVPFEFSGFVRSWGGLEVELLDSSGASKAKEQGDSHFVYIEVDTPGPGTVTVVLSGYPGAFSGVHLRAYFVRRQP